METIDARGLSCPEPVVMTRNALTSGAGTCQVLVDAVAARALEQLRDLRPVRARAPLAGRALAGRGRACGELRRE